MTYRPYNQITASGISDQRQNVSGILMAKGTPVRTTTGGDIDFVDVSNESHAFAVSGVVKDDIANLSVGNILTSGKLLDLTTSASFGDPVYIDKTGNLTTIKPSIGVNGFVSGDFVILIGMIVKNADNPTKKDLLLNIDMIGQL